MRPESEAKLKKLKKVSVVLRAISKVLLAFIALLGLASVVCVGSGLGGVDFDGVLFRTNGLGAGQRLGLAVIAALAWAALLKAFYHLHQLFGSYSRGEVFTRTAVRELGRFGIGCVLWCIMSFVWLSALAISVRPEKTFKGNADALAIGVVIIVIAWFMDMAVDLREENDLTI